MRSFFALNEIASSVSRRLLVKDFNGGQNFLMYFTAIYKTIMLQKSTLQ